MTKKIINHQHGTDSVEHKQKNDSLNKNTFQQNYAQDNLEIERSLYYLGKALYRHSLLQKERSK